MTDLPSDHDLEVRVMSVACLMNYPSTRKGKTRSERMRRKANSWFARSRSVTLEFWWSSAWFDNITHWLLQLELILFLLIIKVSRIVSFTHAISASSYFPLANWFVRIFSDLSSTLLICSSPVHPFTRRLTECMIPRLKTSVTALVSLTAGCWWSSRSYVSLAAGFTIDIDFCASQFTIFCWPAMSPIFGPLFRTPTWICKDIVHYLYCSCSSSALIRYIPLNHMFNRTPPNIIYFAFFESQELFWDSFCFGWCGIITLRPQKDIIPSLESTNHFGRLNFGPLCARYLSALALWSNLGGRRATKATTKRTKDLTST